MTSEPTRREFLRRSTSTLGALALPWPRGAGPAVLPPREQPLLVAIFLRGGIDALNVVVPYADGRYARLRPTIAIPAPGAGEGRALRLDDRFALHPALGRLLPLWQRGAFVPIVGVGSPHPTRSHFDAQDFMEYAAPGLRNVRDGWLNRYLAATAGVGEPRLRALAMQGLLPRSLRGSHPVLAVPDLADVDGVLEPFESMYGDSIGGADPIVAAGRDTIRALHELREVAAGAPAATVRYPDGALGPRLARIARLVRAGAPLEVAAVDFGDFDHHAGEGGVEGKLARLLDHLGQSLSAFAADLGAVFDRTLVLMLSEFGRTVRENGNAGTDHGHGGLVLALGGGLGGGSSGRVLGRFDGLADRDLYRRRDLPATTDFRDVMAEVLRGHLGFTPPAVFFPDHRPGGVVGLWD